MWATSAIVGGAACGLFCCATAAGCSQAETKRPPKTTEDCAQDQQGRAAEPSGLCHAEILLPFWDRKPSLPARRAGHYSPRKLSQSRSIRSSYHGPRPSARSSQGRPFRRGGNATPLNGALFEAVYFPSYSNVLAGRAPRMLVRMVNK